MHTTRRDVSSEEGERWAQGGRARAMGAHDVSLQLASRLEQDRLCTDPLDRLAEHQLRTTPIEPLERIA